MTKRGMGHWFLYSVEQCSYGKRIEWTMDFNSALIFTSEEFVETFKSQNLPNVPVDIHRFPKEKFKTTE